MAFYHFLQLLTWIITRAHDELKSLFGDKASSYTTVKNWCNEFHCGRRSLTDELREDRPKTAVIIIIQDRHVTLREIEASLDISSTSIHSILHEHLFSLDPAQFDKRSKKVRVDWCKGLLNIRYIYFARTPEIGHGLGRILSCGARKPEQT